MGFDIKRDLFGFKTRNKSVKKNPEEAQKQEILSSGLDELTKAELLAANGTPVVAEKRGLGAFGTGINSMAHSFAVHKKLQSVGALFSAAKEGIDPKYKARARMQEMFNTAVDQPGAKQLRTDVMFNTGSNILRA